MRDIQNRKESEYPFFVSIAGLFFSREKIALAMLAMINNNIIECIRYTIDNIIYVSDKGAYNIEKIFENRN